MIFEIICDWDVLVLWDLLWELLGEIDNVYTHTLYVYIQILREEIYIYMYNKLNLNQTLE